jgi:DnaJ-class molecular chaperone
VLGGKTEIISLDDKKIELKVPKSTPSGKVFKISGKGIPHFSGYGRGDLFVKIKVEIPEKLNKSQKELLGKLKEQGL